MEAYLFISLHLSPCFFLAHCFYFPIYVYSGNIVIRTVAIESVLLAIVIIIVMCMQFLVPLTIVFSFRLTTVDTLYVCLYMPNYHMLLSLVIS